VLYNYLTRHISNFNFRCIALVLSILVSSLPLLSAQENSLSKKTITADSGFKTVLLNNKVYMNWGGQNEENISHYIIEKSIDKIECTDVALFFTSDLPDRNANEKFSNNTYAYKDAINIKRNTIIYYRLKTIDKNGVINYTNWQTIDVNKK
jgi:hypothetical protein